VSARNAMGTQGNTGGEASLTNTSADHEKRQRRSKQERRRIVEETLEAGASVARVARAHGVNANQVFQWRKLYHRGLLEVEASPTGLLPVKICAVGEGGAVASAKELIVRRPRPARSGTIHVELAKARLRIEGEADSSSLRAVLECLLG